MEQIEYFDVVIVGGGPAGATAALRLLQLGYRVALVEQHVFPRPQIGESLSPGIWNLLQYLDAAHILDCDLYFHGLDASVIWETKEVQHVPGNSRGPGVMVDRGKFDHDLLQLAVSQGLYLYQPAKFESCVQSDGRWCLTIRRAEGKDAVMANVVLDCRGRSSAGLKEKQIIAPELTAIWTHVPASLMKKETLIEAIKDGWLWGAPTADGQFRIMAFVDPSALKHTKPGMFLPQLLSFSNLFSPALASIDRRKLNTCPVVPYFSKSPWKANYVKLGEAAFTLDPLSSTGVEKAMRISLQAAVAVNTMLQSGEETIARSFYEDRLAEAVATHALWTQDFYSKGWPVRESSFWQTHSAPVRLDQEDGSAFVRQVNAKLQRRNTIRATSPKTLLNVSDFLSFNWNKRFIVAPDVSYAAVPCVVGDTVEMKQAIQHPDLDRPVAYLDSIEIVPITNGIKTPMLLGELFVDCTTKCPPESVGKILQQLINDGILQELI